MAKPCVGTIYILYFATEYIAEYKDWLGAPDASHWVRCFAPSPPAEKATASEDQAWKASTDDGTGDAVRRHGGQ